MPAKYREDFVIQKVINILPKNKQEEEDEIEFDEAIDEEDASVSNNTTTPVDSSGKRKRGRPVGWRKFPDGKPETPKSPRARGRPVGSLGKKKKAMVYREEKPQYYYLGDADDQSK